MPQADPSWQDFLDALVCTGILTYIHLIVGAPRMERLKQLTQKLPQAQSIAARAYGPIIGGGIRLQFVVLASLLPFLDRKKPYKWDFPEISLSLSKHDIILIAGALYLLIRLVGTFVNHELQSSQREEETKSAKLPQLITLDTLWAIEMTFLGLGLCQNVAPILLSALIAHILLTFYSSNICKHLKQNPFLQPAARLLFLFNLLLLIANATGLQHGVSIYVIGSIGIILLSIVPILLKLNRTSQGFEKSL